jgi:hypothetical protein
MRLPRALPVAAIALAALLHAAPSRAEPYTGKLYARETLAQAACEGGAVVWVDPASGRFAVKGGGWYGLGSGDGYACRDRVEPDPFARKTPAPAEPDIAPGIAPGIAPAIAPLPALAAPASPIPRGDVGADPSD